MFILSLFCIVAALFNSVWLVLVSRFLFLFCLFLKQFASWHPAAAAKLVEGRWHCKEAHFQVALAPSPSVFLPSFFPFSVSASWALICCPLCHLHKSLSQICSQSKVLCLSVNHRRHQRSHAHTVYFQFIDKHSFPCFEFLFLFFFFPFCWRIVPRQCSVISLAAADSVTFSSGGTTNNTGLH